MKSVVEKTKSRNQVIALVGNPNTGKTTLFNALAGMRQRVGNYPGVTVETKKGHLAFEGRFFDLVDLPGTYSFAPRSPDEMVAINLLLGRQAGENRPDAVISILDASNLERNLYLATQVFEMGVPVVIALNMGDVARKQGVRVDASKLAEKLGVPVIPIQANKRMGLEELKKAISQVTSSSGRSLEGSETSKGLLQGPSFPEPFEKEVAELRAALGDEISPFLVRRLLLDVGGFTEKILAGKNGEEVNRLVVEARQRLAVAGCPVPAVEARVRYGWIRQVTAGCVERSAQRPVSGTDRLDRVLTHRLWGTLSFLALMFIVFQAIFTGARPAMKWIGDGKDALGDYLAGALPPGPLNSLVVDGVLEGVGSVVVFLPQIIILFGFLAVLEDCGYMARAAFLMDRLMSFCGLSGKSFIPMLSSVACAVPGIMATRVIENRRDRLATILVAPLMSCSARLPVYILLIGAFLTAGLPWWVPGLTMFSLYALGLVIAPLMALVLKRTLLKGATPVFIMEMPVYKWPSARTVCRRMFDSAWAFIYRAGTLILASMVVVWALLYFPRVEANSPSVTVINPGTMKSETKTFVYFDEHLDFLKEELERIKAKAREAGDAQKRAWEKRMEEKQQEIDHLHGLWKRQSWLGRMGHAIEPVVRPLGWDWKIGMAALASFPAREVVVGTLGIIYNLGKVDSDEIRDALDPGETRMAHALRQERREDNPEQKTFTIPVALSLMVFFALCCQCASTLAVIRRETRSWRWPLFTFTYMTVLAYLGALIVFQVGSRIFPS